MRVERLTIIGVGLIGGSLALALRRAGACGRIVGCDQDQECLSRARQLGVIDDFSRHPAEAVVAADMVIIAAPPSATRALMQAMLPGLRESVIISDVASVKGEIVRVARQELGAFLPRFVPGHPIAGTERNGIEAAFAELFTGHRVLLTPLEETSAPALQQVRAMWEAAGARVSCLDVAHHDEVLAATSHLPHLLAYALVDCLTARRDRDEIFQYAAGGFADFTRIASSSPRMWHDICFANRSRLLPVLECFQTHVAALQRAIESDDSAALLDVFVRAKARRDRLTDARREQDG